MSLLTPETIAKLTTVAMRAKVIVDGVLTGMHRATMRGSSVEFAEHKEYSQGDEIRHIDWKVYAKADRYYVKQFEQESELTCYLVLDASGSMHYGSGGHSKCQYASTLVAAFAYLLIQQRDRVGLDIFGSNEIQQHIPPRATAAHLHTLFHAMEQVNDWPQAGNEYLADALERVGQNAGHNRSLILVASDLFETGTPSLPILKNLRAKGHDVVVFHVLHPDEINFPFDEMTIFSAMESEHKLLVDPASVRKLYKQRLQRFLSSVQSSSLSAGIDYSLVTTDMSYDDVIAPFLAQRTSSAVGRRA